MAPVATGGGAGSHPVGATGGAPRATGGTNGSTGGVTIATGGSSAAGGGGRTGEGAMGGTGGAGVGGVRGVGGTPVGAGGTGGGATGTGGGGGAPRDADLVLWYPFDEDVGTTASDQSGFPGGPRDGLVTVSGTDGSATFTPSHRVGTHALALSGNGVAGGGYVVLPSLVDLAPSAVTIAVWVFPTSGVPWQRVFDFGNDKRTTYMFLTLGEGSDANHVVRFGITQTGTDADQAVDGSAALTLDVWHHLAVVLNAGSPYTGVLYVDGAEVGSNAAMTLHPADLGPTAQNYIGRSQYEADPYANALFDDFRVYRRALTAAAIAALGAPP